MVPVFDLVSSCALVTCITALFIFVFSSPYYGDVYLRKSILSARPVPNLLYMCEYIKFYGGPRSTHGLKGLLALARFGEMGEHTRAFGRSE